jgi:hypothetical protein
MAVPISRRVRLVTVVLTVAGAAGAASACTPGDSKSEVEHSYLKAIDVRGHEFLRDIDQQETSGLVLGPATADLTGAVSGPGLTVRAATSDMGDPVLALVATGSGRATTGAACEVLIYRLRPGQEPPADWKISGQQVTGIRSGRSEALKVSVGCPFST